MLRAAALRRGLSTSQSKRVVVVDGARIPFAMAGTSTKTGLWTSCATL